MTLYTTETDLFHNNLSERAIVFRFAYHLQKMIEEESFYVDCDYNLSYILENNEYKASNGKNIQNTDGTLTGRFIDIIVRSKRVPDHGNTDIFCFECKKWNNHDKKGIEKDKNNLRALTTTYGYQYGFHLIFGKKKEDVKLYIYKTGQICNDIYPFFVEKGE